MRGARRGAPPHTAPPDPPRCLGASAHFPLDLPRASRPAQGPFPGRCDPCRGHQEGHPCRRRSGLGAALPGRAHLVSLSVGLMLGSGQHFSADSLNQLRQGERQETRARGKRIGGRAARKGLWAPGRGSGDVAACAPPPAAPPRRPHSPLDLLRGRPPPVGVPEGSPKGVEGGPEPVCRRAELYPGVTGCNTCVGGGLCCWRRGTPSLALSTHPAGLRQCSPLLLATRCRCCGLAACCCLAPPRVGGAASASLLSKPPSSSEAISVGSASARQGCGGSARSGLDRGVRHCVSDVSSGGSSPAAAPGSP